MSRPSLNQLAGVFFRIGNTTFGGGLLTMTVLGRELVERKQWIAAEDYELAFALARVTPGTSIIAFCAAAGWLILGLSGALAAVFVLTAPTAVLAVLLLQGIDSSAGHPLIMAAVAATVAAVAGMMWAIVWIIIRPYAKAQRVRRAPPDGPGTASRRAPFFAHFLERFEPILRSAIIAGGAFLASWKFNVTPVPVLAAATLASLLWGFFEGPSPEARTGPARPSAEPPLTQPGSVVPANSPEARTGPAGPFEPPGSHEHSAQPGSVVPANSKDAPAE
jgi:chromate transporter